MSLLLCAAFLVKTLSGSFSWEVCSHPKWGGIRVTASIPARGAASISRTTPKWICRKEFHRFQVWVFSIRDPTVLEHKLVQPLWRTVWRFLKKLEIELPYDPAIPLLGIHTKETRIERDTCTPVFISELFIITRTWKQPRCPSADEWKRKLWYIYTMEYYPAIKKNTFESVLMNWMNLEPFIQK